MIFFSLSDNHGGAFVGLMCNAVCPKNSGYVTANRNFSIHPNVKLNKNHLTKSILQFGLSIPKQFSKQYKTFTFSSNTDTASHFFKMRNAATN